MIAGISVHRWDEDHQEAGSRGAQQRASQKHSPFVVAFGQEGTEGSPAGGDQVLGSHEDAHPGCGHTQLPQVEGQERGHTGIPDPAHQMEEPGHPQCPGDVPLRVGAHGCRIPSDPEGHRTELDVGRAGLHVPGREDHGLRVPSKSDCISSPRRRLRSPGQRLLYSPTSGHPPGSGPAPGVRLGGGGARAPVVITYRTCAPPVPP